MYQAGVYESQRIGGSTQARGKEVATVRGQTAAASASVGYPSHSSVGGGTAAQAAGPEPARPNDSRLADLLSWGAAPALGRGGRGEALDGPGGGRQLGGGPDMAVGPSAAGQWPAASASRLGKWAAPMATAPPAPVPSAPAPLIDGRPAPSSSLLNGLSSPAGSELDAWLSDLSQTLSNDDLPAAQSLVASMQARRATTEHT